MGRFAVATTLVATLTAGAASAASFGPLVTPTQLAEQAPEVQPLILDIRDKGYDQGHLPGAISAPYASFRGPEKNPGEVPATDALEATFESYGLQPDKAVVIVPEGKNDTDFGAAARVYWTLKSTGFTDLTILNGGTQAWAAAGLPVDNAPVTPSPSTLDLTFNDTWTASTEAVSQVVEGKQAAVLVDARPTDFFDGRAKHDQATKPGTLPGAENLPYQLFFASGSPTIKPSTDTAALKQTLGLEDGEEVVSFCNTGHWAATDWFALSELAGIENVKLYPGSMVEYSQAGLPMENVPGLLRNLTRQIFGG